MTESFLFLTLQACQDSRTLAFPLCFVSKTGYFANFRSHLLSCTWRSDGLAQPLPHPPPEVISTPALTQGERKTLSSATGFTAPEFPCSEGREHTSFDDRQPER